jgi:hypothetical protein
MFSTDFDTYNDEDEDDNNILFFIVAVLLSGSKFDNIPVGGNLLDDIGDLSDDEAEIDGIHGASPSVSGVTGDDLLWAFKKSVSRSPL